MTKLSDFMENIHMEEETRVLSQDPIMTGPPSNLYAPTKYYIDLNGMEGTRARHHHTTGKWENGEIIMKKKNIHIRLCCGYSEPPFAIMVPV